MQTSSFQYKIHDFRYLCPLGKASGCGFIPSTFYRFFQYKIYGFSAKFIVFLDHLEGRDEQPRRDVREPATTKRPLTGPSSTPQAASRKQQGAKLTMGKHRGARSKEQGARSRKQQAASRKVAHVLLSINNSTQQQDHPNDSFSITTDDTGNM